MLRMKCVVNIIFLLFFSCTTRRNTGVNDPALDTIPKEIKVPYQKVTSAGTDDQKLVQNTAKFMGLPSLSDGHQGLYVRIWLWGLDHIYYVVNIWSNKTEHQCSVVQWTGQTEKEDTNVYIFAIHRQWINLQPKSGWNNFDSMLVKCQIASLRNGMSSKDMPDIITPAAYVDFEIAQPANYRYYEYLEPSFSRYIDDGSNKVYQFLKFFNREMNVRVYNPADSLYIDPINRKKPK